MPGAPTRFVGLDQTGAATCGGRASKPLPAASLTWGEGGWVLRGPLAVPALTPAHLAALGRLDADLVVLVDAGLGLPAARWDALGLPRGPEGLWQLLARARAHPGLGARVFGRDVAEAFFSALPDVGPDTRGVDDAVGAWSLFRVRPYQRNVQTGTWRVWRDLGAPGEAWARVAGFDPPGTPDPRPWLAEGYPSLAWRQLTGEARGRVPLQTLCAALEVQLVQAGAFGPDALDAALLALHGAWLAAQGRLWPDLEACDGAEGWIAGAAGG